MTLDPRSRPGGHFFPMFVVAGLLASAACIVPAHADPIDDFLSAELQKRQIPGLSLAIVKDGKVEKLAAYGLANIETSAPASPDTVFQIQSITKTFTSTAILMLAQEKKLSIDDPVSKHLAGTPDIWKDITLRHLLSHTSGLKDFINEPTANLRLEVTDAEVFKAAAARPLNFPPGEKYAYSNTNYHLLVMILRQITGKSYGQFLHERLFTPHAMASTRIYNQHDLIPNRAAGYYLDHNTLRNGHFVAESILAYGGGGILSTARDMARWAIALDAGKVLDKSTLDAAWTPFKLKSGASTAYGLGWVLGNTNGHRSISHGGAHMTGFTSNFLYYPQDRLAVIVLTNARHANPARIAQRVAGLVNPALAPGQAKPIEDKEPAVTQLIRATVLNLRDGKIDPEKFTPALLKAMESAKPAIQADLAQSGDFKSIDLLWHSDQPKVRSYRYRLTFDKRTWIVNASLQSDTQFGGFWINEE